MNTKSQRPLLIVLSAPSGAGKTTLGRQLLEAFPRMRRSVTCTTRRPRPGETDGQDYIFLDSAAFELRIQAGDFLEHAEVYGRRYGTLRRSVEDGLRRGEDVLLIIDVQGAASVRRAAAADEAGGLLRMAFVDIFVVPPDLETLRRRLVGRAQDSASVIERRLESAAREMDCRDQYRYLIVNDCLEDALFKLKSVIVAEHCRIGGF